MSETASAEAKKPRLPLVSLYSEPNGLVDVTSAEFQVALGCIERDPTITLVNVCAAATASEIDSFQRCLKRAPHVASLCFLGATLSADAMARWIQALPQHVLVDFGERVLPEVTPSAVLTSVRRMRLHGIQGPCWVEAITAQQVVNLEWEDADGLRHDSQSLTCRSLAAATQLRSLKFDWLVSEVTHALCASVNESSTLTSLEVSDAHEEPPEVEPLWAALRDSKTCLLERLVMNSYSERLDLAPLCCFLATDRARENLRELRLHKCDRASAPQIMFALATHCLPGALSVLELVFGLEATLRSDVEARAKREATTQRIVEQQATTTRCFVLSSFSFAVQNDATEGPEEDDALMRAFLALIGANARQLQFLDLNSVSFGSVLTRFHAPLLPAIACARAMELEFAFSFFQDQVQADKPSDFDDVLAALSRNSQLETLKIYAVRETLALRLTAWLPRDAPSTLTDITLDLDTVSPLTLVFLIDVLSTRPLLHLRISKFDEETPRSLYCVTIVRLLRLIPSLRTLVVNIGAFTASSDLVIADKTEKEARAAMHRAILTHASLEETNLVPRNETALDVRRLRRHRLAAHWAHVAVALVFARGHASALHGSILPLLPCISALAGLVLPKQGWAESFTRSVYFYRDSAPPLASRLVSRKRKAE